MLYCTSCKIWVQPIQWIESAWSGELDLSEACPSCHQTATTSDRPARDSLDTL